MSTPSLPQAQALLDAGQPSKALEVAWKAVRPAVLNQDDEALRSTMQFAETLAIASSGEVRDDAEQLASYCSGCLLEPRDSIPSVFSLKRVFGRGQPAMKKCPDCAEAIQPDAKVCRYCGYRYPEI